MGKRSLWQKSNWQICQFGWQKPSCYLDFICEAGYVFFGPSSRTHLHFFLGHLHYALPKLTVLFLGFTTSRTILMLYVCNV